MRKNVLKQSEMVALADAIRVVCHKTENGCIYTEGWSDQRFVDESAGKLTIHNVVGLRQELLGKLTTPKSVDPLQDALDKLAIVEKRVQSLERWAFLRPVAPFEKLA